MLSYLKKLTFNLSTEVVMRALILIVSIIISGYSFAHEFREYDFAVISKSECENYGEAISIYKEINNYMEANAPNSMYMRCGMDLEGNRSCLFMTDSFEAYEENLSWGEEDEEWTRLIRLAWNKCGIDDFGFDSEAVTFE